MVKVVEKVVTIKGAPAYMVSFGDMMTLILCFFILLVAMSKERNFGLMARGLGSFVIAIESHGLNGILSGQEKQEIFDTMRRRFNLPPEEDPQRRADNELASLEELVRAEALEALKPSREIHQPALARFQGVSTTLDRDAKAYLEAQADSLRPAPGQRLLLEGHGPPRGFTSQASRTWIAHRRAAAVRDHLIDHLDFDPDRVEARAWMVEIDDNPQMTNVVHARLVIPSGKQE